MTRRGSVLPTPDRNEAYLRRESAKAIRVLESLLWYHWGKGTAPDWNEVEARVAQIRSLWP
jgi:hypothetical protein